MLTQSRGEDATNARNAEAPAAKDGAEPVVPMACR